MMEEVIGLYSGDVRKGRGVGVLSWFVVVEVLV